MGNMFLGFPVPRAKIADMIATDAPPTLHKENHESGGKDELDCTGLVGAGGISLPFDDLHFHTLFESLDYYSKNTNGAGAVVGGSANISCEVYGANGDRAQIYKDLTYKYVPLTWAKNREFRVQAEFYADTNSTQKLEIGTGHIWTSYGFGFKVQDGLLKAYSKGAGGTYEETIEDWGSSGYYEQRKLRARLTAGSKVEFYVNDVLVKTDTTCYPTGTTYASRIFQATSNNPIAGNSAMIYLSEFQLWQEA